MRIKENAERLQKILMKEKDIPKWAEGVIGEYFNTDSIHLYIDEYDKLIADLEKLKAGDYPADLAYLVKSLNYQILEKTCEACGKKYETFSEQDKCCSMSCFSSL